MASGSDDFTGFTSGNLEDRTNWDLNTGSTGDMTGDTGGQVEVQGNIGTGTYNWTTAFSGNDVSVSCTVDPKTITTSFRACGPLVITDLGNFTGYYFRANKSGAALSHNLEIVSGGSFQAGTNYTTDWIAGEKLTVTVTDIGGGQVDVKGYVDDVLRAQLDAQTAVGTATWYAGLYGNSNNSNVRPTMDDFEFADAAAAAGGLIAGSLSLTGVGI